MRRRIAAFLAATALVALTAAGGAATEDLAIRVEAPPALEPIAARIRRLDHTRLVEALARAGLAPPRGARITLVSEMHPRALAAPPWVVAQASGLHEIVIFPARVGAYPHGSLEAVVWHEVVHLALTARAGGRPLPRWFHEGVAMSVEGWGLGGRARLLAAAFSDPSIADVNRLFASDRRPESATAYLLAAALITDVRRRHGDAVPGAIAGRVALGAPFGMAFAAETGTTPDAAANRAWANYRRWVDWVPLITSGTFVWFGILLVACAAFVAQMRRRLRQRRQWDDEGVGGVREADDSVIVPVLRGPDLPRPGHAAPVPHGRDNEEDYGDEDARQRDEQKP